MSLAREWADWIELVHVDPVEKEDPINDSGEYLGYEVRWKFIGENTPIRVSIENFVDAEYFTRQLHQDTRTEPGTLGMYEIREHGERLCSLYDGTKVLTVIPEPTNPPF